MILQLLRKIPSAIAHVLAKIRRSPVSEILIFQVLSISLKTNEAMNEYKYTGELEKSSHF